MQTLGSMVYKMEAPIVVPSLSYKMEAPSVVPSLFGRWKLCRKALKYKNPLYSVIVDGRWLRSSELKP